MRPFRECGKDGGVPAPPEAAIGLKSAGNPGGKPGFGIVPGIGGDPATRIKNIF